MIQWVYKWLPIIFGCHCRADRSFFVKGRQFPICARCTGELVGMVTSALVCIFWLPPWWIVGILAVPMLVDGFVQLLTEYESTNLRRVITGLLFGYALVAAFAKLSAWAASLGYQLGQNMVE